MRWSPPSRLAALERIATFNAIACWLGSCVVLRSCVSPPSQPCSRFGEIADTRRAFTPAHDFSRSRVHSWTFVCLHALSSFQRTGMPDEALQPRRVPTERPFPSVLGEPSEVTTDCPGCQPHAVCWRAGMVETGRVSPEPGFDCLLSLCRLRARPDGPVTR